MDHSSDEKHRRRLGQLIEARRVELRLTQAELTTAIPMSKEGLRKLVGGTGAIRELTKGGIETALWWAPGSIDAVLAGGDPSPIGALTRLSGMKTVMISVVENGEVKTYVVGGGTAIRAESVSSGEAFGIPIVTENVQLRRGAGGESVSVWDAIRDELDADAAEAAGMSVDDFRLEERVARQTRIMREEGDLEAAAELDQWLKARENRKAQGDREAG